MVYPRTLSFVFSGDEVLLIKITDDKEWGGWYNGLGGHIEKGEGIIEGAEREIKEESGLSPINTELSGIIHVSDFYGKDVMMFVTKSECESKVIEEENREGKLEWVKIGEVGERKVFDDVEPILKKISEGEFFTGVSRFDGEGELVELKFEN